MQRLGDFVMVWTCDSNVKQVLKGRAERKEECGMGDIACTSITEVIQFDEM